MEHLPEDLIEEILLRVPRNTLHIFKRVSKNWLQLITSHRFAIRQAQLPNPRGNADFLVFRSAPKIFVVTPLCVRKTSSGAHQFFSHVTRNIELEFPPREILRIFPLMFPLGLGVYCVLEAFSRTVLLWNPTTRQTRILPKAPACLIGTYGTHHFGKFYVEDGKFCYKVGRLTSSLILELYSSRTGCWESIPNDLSGKFSHQCNGTTQSINLKGWAHMLMTQPFEESSFILSFDYNESFRRIKVPPALDQVGLYDRRRTILTLYDDKFLCLVCSWKNNYKTFLDFWVMRECGVEDSWVKEITVGPIPEGMIALGFSSKVRGIILQKTCHSELYLYDCMSSNITKCGSSLIDGYYDRNLQVMEREELYIHIP